MKGPCASVTLGWAQATARSRALASGVRTAMKRKFRKLKDIGVVVAIFTSSRIWSSPKVTAGSSSLVVLRLARHSMMALAKVIHMVSYIRHRLPPSSLDDIRDREPQLSHRGPKDSKDRQ